MFVRRSFKSFILVCGFLSLASYAFSGCYYNGSSFSTRLFTLDSSGEVVVKNSTITASEKMDIKIAGVLKGDGLLDSPLIKIVVEKFDFTGTIKCNGTCDLIVKEPFDQKMFKRVGTGTFTITVNPDYYRFIDCEPKEFKAKDFTLTLHLLPIIEIADAIVAGDTVLLQELIKNNNEALLDNGCTGLIILAALHGHLAIAEELIALLGSDIDKIFAGGTLLMHAASIKSVELTRFLLAAGAKPDEKAPFDGMTPLMLAAYRGSKEIVEMLLTAGADKTITKGFRADAPRARDFARAQGHRTIAKLL